MIRQIHKIIIHYLSKLVKKNNSEITSYQVKDCQCEIKRHVFLIKLNLDYRQYITVKSI